MSLSSFFKKLTGGGTAGGAEKAGNAVEYQGYTIRPIPKKQGAQFITAGVISKTFGDAIKEETFIRADTHSSFDSACDHAVAKARQIIDEQGDRLFRDN